jgi:cytidylate kinase
MVRVLTVSREYASGGGHLARRLAGRLGWRLMDRDLIQRIAQAARVEPQVAEQFDERVDPWFHRLSKAALWRGAFEGVAAVTDEDFFDAARMAELARRLIEEAAALGDCVIVGRGAQCALRGRPEAFHLFVYAPRAERLKRARSRGAADPEFALNERDRARASYVREYYQEDTLNPHLYHLMINSALGEATAISTILTAMGKEGGTSGSP